ncbi:MAG: hypothetical protein ACOCYZ_05930 [Halococcoides sp.]
MGIAETYSAAFAPEQTVLVALLLVAIVEARFEEDGPKALVGRAGTALVGRAGTVLLGAGVAVALIALTPELLVGESAGDLQASLALIVGLGVITAIWRIRGWGDHVVWACVTIAAVSVVHAVIVPFWNLSGHVAFTATPLGAVALADRRALVLVAVPIAMMPARVGTGVHTPLEVVAGFGLALVALAILAWARPEYRQSWSGFVQRSRAVVRSHTGRS